MNLDFWEAIAGRWRYKPDERKIAKYKKVAEEQAEQAVHIANKNPRNPLAGWESEEDDDE